MSKSFRKLVEEAKQSGNIEERLSFGGHYPQITPRRALAEDWMFVLDECKADLAQNVRLFSDPDSGRANRTAARKHLAELAAIAEAMAVNLHRMD